VKVDDLAHELEHSLEVQVPFLQYLFGDRCLLLPIVMYDQGLASCTELGKALAEVLRGKNAVIVATSDFTHYEAHEAAQRKDRLALRAIEELDAKALLKVITRHNITMCGPGPVSTAMIASLELGAARGRTLCYATSGDVSGNYHQVVGYGALALE
jgi:AmmeMemoRadiSam system protein B